MSLFAESSNQELPAPPQSVSVQAESLSKPSTGAADAESPRATEPLAAPLLFAEDLSVGDSWATSFREISESDVQVFSDLTGDHTALHGDSSAPSPYGRPVAHGLLGLSVLAGLGTHHPKVSTLALVGLEQWEFLAPVFFGDRVQAKNEIVEISAHGRRAVKVRWLRQLLSESGKVLQSGFFVTLVGSRERGRPKPR